MSQYAYHEQWANICMHCHAQTTVVRTVYFVYSTKNNKF